MKIYKRLASLSSDVYETRQVTNNAINVNGTRRLGAKSVAHECSGARRLTR
uniref:Uncharacterized protein n=1 Tax=Parascaris univalens TaxID=6257 RepID=A0A914ZQT4_PARUN